MTKVNLNDVVNLQNETTAVNTINSNSAVIETAFDNTLSRDGTSPNQMGATLDMNSFQIVNLPTPVNNTSPLRVQDVLSGISTTVAATGTSGHVVPFLDTANTWSATQTYAGIAADSVASAAITGTSVTVAFVAPIPVGGTTGLGLKFSSTPNLGIFFGSGVPTLSATKGSLYIRTDGSTTSSRMYINTNGSTTWTSVITAA